MFPIIQTSITELLHFIITLRQWNIQISKETLELVSQNYQQFQILRYIGQYISTYNLCLYTKLAYHLSFRELNLLPILDFWQGIIFIFLFLFLFYFYFIFIFHLFKIRVQGDTMVTAVTNMSHKNVSCKSHIIIEYDKNF